MQLNCHRLTPLKCARKVICFPELRSQRRGLTAIKMPCRPKRHLWNVNMISPELKKYGQHHFSRPESQSTRIPSSL